ncbi:MAG TPA: non-homologous end-joining DNA ligase [Byssovorax sp.]|jgi:bifunctional non-homologous end joining protein LigD
MVVVSNADRVVFPEIGRTKGEVVAYYERVAELLLPHVVGRPLSLKRYPKGVAGPGFFQKNVPPHYPASIARFPVPRSAAATKARKGKAAEAEETVYPLIETAEHLAYLANQGALELHVTTARAAALHRPDRLVLDLDPPPGATALVRAAAKLARAALADLGLASAVVATGSKGYHVIAPIAAEVDGDTLADAMQKLGALMAAAHPDVLTTRFRIAARGERVFVDWLRNRTMATVVAPYSLRARPRASVATPLAWDELDVTAPDAFSIDDLARLLDRPDPLAELSSRPADPRPFVAEVDARFERAGLSIEPFDRFRS